MSTDDFDSVLRALALAPPRAAPKRIATVLSIRGAEAHRVRQSCEPFEADLIPRDDGVVAAIVGVGRAPHAAACALAVQRACPGARIAVASGVVPPSADGVAMAAIVERAARLDPAEGEIRVDAETAELLGDTFVVSSGRLVDKLASTLAVGDRLGGRYVVRAFLGEGGMGAVFRALDEKLGEDVALKVVPNALGDALRDEVRLAQKVTHPNVCRTYDLEDVDGHQLVKMEYVAGETLTARLRRDGALPIAQALRIARAIADGLAAAHASRIVHRDLKPGNVMLAGERTVLMDFGVARFVSGPIAGVAGTLGYMAPEQLANHDVDERADLYALGCLLYEMLAGEPVFGLDKPIELATRHASVRAPDVRGKRPETPRWLSRAVARLLAKAPDERTAGLALLRRGPRSKPKIAVVAAIVIAVGGTVAWRAARTHEWRPEIVDFPVFDENGDIVSISPDGNWIAFDSDRVPKATQIYLMDRPTGGAEVVADTFGLARPVERWAPRWTRDGRALLFHAGPFGSTTLYRQPMSGMPPHPDGPPEPLGIGNFPDDCGDAIVYVDETPHNFRIVLRANDGTVTTLARSGPQDGVSSPRCDPSGSQIAYITSAGQVPGDVYFADRAGGVRRLTTGFGAFALAFTPDGKSLVVSADRGEGKRQLFEIAVDGSTRRQLTFDDAPDAAVDVSRDGRYLAFTRDDTSYFPVVYEPEQRFLTKRRGAYFFPREVDPDRIVVQIARPREIATVRVSDGTTNWLAPGFAPFPSRDGTRIYFTTSDAPMTLFAIPTAGGSITALATLPGKISHGLDAVDGQHLLVATGDDAFAGYRVGRDGVAQEHASGLVSPAPSGGWRVVAVPRERWTTELQLIPPGHALDAPSQVLTIAIGQVTWLDDHTIGYCRGDGCVLHDLASNVVTSLHIPGSAMAVVARDGKRVFDIEAVGRTTYHLITNFDTR